MGFSHQELCIAGQWSFGKMMVSLSSQTKVHMISGSKSLLVSISSGYTWVHNQARSAKMAQSIHFFTFKKDINTLSWNFPVSHSSSTPVKTLNKDWLLSPLQVKKKFQVRYSILPNRYKFESFQGPSSNFPQSDSMSLKATLVSHLIPGDCV